MSLNTSLIMLEGNHLQRAEEVFSTFGYKSAGKVEEFNDWDDALAAQQDPRPHKSSELVHKAVFVDGGWTLFLDLAGVMWTDTAACTEASAKLGCRLFAICCAGVTNSYAYGLYDGTVVRAFWWDAEAGVLEDRGEKLLEEDGVDFEEFGEEAVLTVMERIGVSYSNLEEVEDFRVFELSLSGSPDAATIPAEAQSVIGREEKKTPWWKFW